MLKKIIQFLFTFLVLSLVLSPAWAATPVDRDSKPLDALSLQSPDSDGSDLQADILKGRFVIARGGAGGGGAAGGNADCDGSGPNGMSGPGSGEKAGPQIQSRQHYRHQHQHHYSEFLPNQGHYGPGDGDGYDGEGPKDGSGYGAPGVR